MQVPERRPRAHHLDSTPKRATTSMATAEAVARLARTAYDASSLVDSSERVAALTAVSSAISRHKDEILEANARDLEVGQLVFLPRRARLTSRRPPAPKSKLGTRRLHY
jgi:glutamate-5-semialdehyde dehydrogenase